jgi:hypothetical protein
MTLNTDLVELLARHPYAIQTNTPLDVLAAHMIASLYLFEQSLKDRADHAFYNPGKVNAP